LCIKVSIIVPVYNVEKYLDKCIGSVLNQTLKEYELILINDGSTDKSGEICDYYRECDERVKVVHSKNFGPSAARNIGINLAKGEYLGFIDSDDWVEPDMYENLYDACVKTHSELAITGIREVNEDGLELNKYIPSNITFSEILKRAYPCNKLFKRSLFIENNLFFPTGRYYEDVELIPKLYIKSRGITSVSNISYNYLKRNGSTTTSRDEKVLDNIWAFIQVKNYLIEENLYSNYILEYNKSVLYFKRYFLNLIYDYPSSFLFRNKKRIFKGFQEIGGFKRRDYITLLNKHILFSIKKGILLTKIKIGKLFI
jgi:glycosyltransferase involved in cell wall biosynthesis